MRDMCELSPITYYDHNSDLRLNCYADTFVYHKASGTERDLAAIRFGGYLEQVRAMSDVLRKGVNIEATVEGHKIILQARNNTYKLSISHDGIYAERTIIALDDESSDVNDNEQQEVENPNAKRKMYILCNEGDTDSLFSELDKKTSVPLIPEFKDYILSECFKQKILVQLEVLSVNKRFDAYMLELHNDEMEIEKIVNDGLKIGCIVIPGSADGNSFSDISTVSQYLNKYGTIIASRIGESFNPLFDPSSEPLSDSLNIINENLNKNVGIHCIPRSLQLQKY